MEVRHERVWREDRGETAVVNAAVGPFRVTGVVVRRRAELELGPCGQCGQGGGR